MSEIIIKDVSKTYETKDGEVQALKDVNLEIEQGDAWDEVPSVSPLLTSRFPAGDRC